MDQRRAPVSMLGTDAGTEFLNRECFEKFNFHNVYHHILRPPKKAFFAELQVKQVQLYIHKYLYQTNRKKYINQLENIVTIINSLTLRNTDHQRDEVTFKNQHKLKQSSNRSGPVKDLLKIGQKVHIPVQKTIFYKGYKLGQWDTSRKFEIISMVRSHGPVIRYRIKDLEDGVPIFGAFYRQQLLPIDDTASSSSSSSALPVAN